MHCIRLQQFMYNSKLHARAVQNAWNLYYFNVYPSYKKSNSSVCLQALNTGIYLPKLTSEFDTGPACWTTTHACCPCLIQTCSKTAGKFQLFTASVTHQQLQEGASILHDWMAIQT